jgi:hypothetical protein
MSTDELDETAAQIRGAWADLESEARAEMAAEGIDATRVKFRYGVAARYIGQLESFDTVLPDGNMSGAADVGRMIGAFEDMYTKLYPESARFPDAGYSLTSVNLEAIAPKPQPSLPTFELAGAEPDASAFVETREVYHKNTWCEFKVYEMAELKPGNEIDGPAIIRDPMTTVVIPPAQDVVRLTSDPALSLATDQARITYRETSHFFSQRLDPNRPCRRRYCHRPVGDRSASRNVCHARRRPRRDGDCAQREWRENTARRRGTDGTRTAAAEDPRDWAELQRPH